MLQLTNEFWAGIIGAVVGAVVGGVISFVVQMYALKSAKKDREDDRTATREALAHSLLFKMTRIFSHLVFFSRHVEEEFAKAERDKFDGQPCLIVLPIANPPDRVTFLSDEMSMLLSLKDDDLFNDLLVLDEVHNSMIALFEIYKAKRDVLADLLPASEVDGNKISTKLSAQQAQVVMPKMVELDRLILDIRSTVAADAKKAEQCLNRLAGLFEKKIGLETKIIPKIPTTAS